MHACAHSTTFIQWDLWIGQRVGAGLSLPWKEITGTSTEKCHSVHVCPIQLITIIIVKHYA